MEGHQVFIFVSSSKTISKESWQKIANLFKARHSGPDNAGEVIVLNSDFHWHSSAKNTQDMDYSDAARAFADQLRLDWSSSPELSGDVAHAGESSKANIEASYKIFCRHTVIPLSKKISQFLSVFFSQSFKKDVNIQFIYPDEVI